MNALMKGQAWLFGDMLDVDWEICPYETFVQVFRARGIKNPTAEEVGQYCMIVVDPEFPKKVKKGDFIVAGETFGYGHDHDHACLAILGAGVAAVICNSCSGLFLRMALERGLPVVEYPGIRQLIDQADLIELDLVGGTIRNVTKNQQYSFVPYPKFLLDMIEAGGVLAITRKRLAATSLPA